MRIVITGANRGIGLGLVKAFANRGDEVHAAVRELDRAGELRALESKNVTLHKVDVTRDEDCQSLGAALAGKPIDLVINNAGVGGRWRGLEELDLEGTMQVFEINALGALRVTRALLPSLEAARGTILNVTSRMGSIGDNSSGGAYAYRMSKAALNMATRSLAIELGPRGVKAVVVHPGWVKTEMGGPSATTSVETAVKNIVELTLRLQPSDTGKFFHADGQELPW